MDGFVDGCPALTEISVSEENQDLVVIDGILYNRELTDLIAYPAGATKECVVIPDGIRVIRGDAFLDNPYLKKWFFQIVFVQLAIGHLMGVVRLKKLIFRHTVS